MVCLTLQFIHCVYIQVLYWVTFLWAGSMPCSLYLLWCLAHGRSLVNIVSVDSVIHPNIITFRCQDSAWNRTIEAVQVPRSTSNYKSIPGEALKFFMALGKIGGMEPLRQWFSSLLCFGMTWKACSTEGPQAPSLESQGEYVWGSVHVSVV